MNASTCTAPTSPATPPALRATVRNWCQCRFCDVCALPFAGDACMCGRPGIPEPVCAGCVEDACEYVGLIAAQWFEANPARGDGWIVDDGESTLTADSPLLDAMALGGRWEQVWTVEPWEGGSLSFVVLQDGKPVGAPVVVRP